MLFPSYPIAKRTLPKVSCIRGHGASILRRAVRRPAPALAVRDPDPDAPRRPRRRCGDACPAGATSRSPRRHGLCSGEGHRVDQGELNLLTRLLTFDWAYTHYYSAIMAIHTGARPESEGAQGYGALHRGGPAEACHGPDARLQQLPGHHRSGARAHACHARRACLLRAPNRHTSHATTLPQLNRSPRRAACLSLGGARMSPSCHPCRCSAPRCRHCCRCRRR